MTAWIKKLFLFILLAFALLGVYSIYSNFSLFQSKTEVNSSVLLERIEKVIKLVAVEGSFSEIYNYRNHVIVDIWPFRKKALLRVNAKVLVGYDFEKVTMDIDHDRHVITINHIPDPEILSIEHDLDYYNFENGLFNMISNKDITEMGFQAKDFIAKKAEESDLFQKAEEQRKDLFEILELAIQASGWTLEIKGQKMDLKQ